MSVTLSVEAQDGHARLLKAKRQLERRLTAELDETGHLADLVHGLPAACHRIMVVGHNPVISRLAHWLEGDDANAEFVPATMAAYRIDANAWGDVHPALTRRIALLSPLD